MFLRKYRFGPARDYFLVHEGRRYPSKAIAGAAHGYEHPSLGPLVADQFTGGLQTVHRKLVSLGFEVTLPASDVGKIGGRRLGKRSMMERFGGTLRNVRWSWDAVTSDGSIIFIGWEDDALRDASGALLECRIAKADHHSNSPGAAERLEHIEALLASDAAGYLALAAAKDVDAVPRQIASIDDRLYTVRVDRRFEGVFAVIVAENSAPERTGEGDVVEAEELQFDERITPTEKQQISNARRGQGLFRARVELIERGCRLTGVVDRAHLGASHIKPWRACTNTERLDGHNGLLLAPHIDHLFDRGFCQATRRTDPLATLKLTPLSRLGYLVFGSRPAFRFCLSR